MIYSRILFAVDSIYPLFSGPDAQIRLEPGAIAWRILPGNSGLALVLRTLRFAMTWARLGIRPDPAALTLLVRVIDLIAAATPICELCSLKTNRWSGITPNKSSKCASLKGSVTQLSAAPFRRRSSVQSMNGKRSAQEAASG